MSAQRTMHGRRRAGAVGPLILMALMALSLPAPVAAQEEATQGGSEMTRQEMQSRILRGFERRLARELRLDSEQLGQVQEVMRSMHEARRELFQRRRALQARRESFREGDGGEASARAILSEMRAVRAEEARIETEEEARLLEVLSPSQVLRFQIMRAELNDRIRRMHREAADTTRGGRG